MSSNEEVLKQLPNDAVRSALLEIIENNIPTKDYILHMEEGSEKGDNYIGVLHRLSITYKSKNQDDTTEPQKLGIFIKVPPDNLVRRQQFFARPCFLRESLVYDEILPLLVEFQETKGINPEKTGFKEYTKCFKNLTDDLEEAIFLEDLSLKDFRMHDRFESPCADLVKLIMKALGKLHALSFALKHQWPETFARYMGLEEIFAHRKDDSIFTDYFNSLSEIACNALSQEGDNQHLQRIQELFESKPVFDRMLDLVDGSKAEPYAVICHGDCWNNNILFRYENGKPVEAKLIDWQLTRFASPVCDLMYYIFCCTSKTLRDEFYEEFLDTYYSELATFMQRLDSDPERLFSRKTFDDQLKKFGSFGLIMGLMVIPTISTKKDDVPNLDELSAKIEAGDIEYAKQALQKSVKSSSSRIRDVIIDLIRLGYI